VLHQIIHHADNILAQHFVLLWFISFALVIVVGWLVSPDPNPAWSPGLGQATWETNVKRLSQLGWADGLSGFLFIGFAIFYSYLIFYKEDFSYYDDDLLTDFSLQGKSFAPPIWTGVGRFYPLADQEFNLLSFLTRSPFGYHALVVLQLIILIVVIFLILREFRFRYRCLIAAAVMMAPSFLIPFMGFVYPERNVLFGMAILLLCLQRYYRSRSRLYFLGALGTTHFILYYKETVVLFVVTFAITYMFLQLYQSLSAGPRSWRILLLENVLPLGMLGVAGIYTVLFLAAMLPHRGFSYVNGLREPLSSVLVSYCLPSCCLESVASCSLVFRLILYGIHSPLERLFTSSAFWRSGLTAATIWPPSTSWRCSTSRISRGSGCRSRQEPASLPSPLWWYAF
jgi:hypothetical protein